MPINGNPTTAVISGNVMFAFDTDFNATGGTPATAQQNYINAFRANVMSVWDNVNAPLIYNGNRVTVPVTFGPEVAGAPGWKLIAGNGNGTLAQTIFGPGDIRVPQSISFVDYAHETGYLFQARNATEAAHEFGHMVRLADRYSNGFRVNFTQPLPQRYPRTTAPLSRCYSKELNQEASATIGQPYDPYTNLMSSSMAVGGTLTNRQLGFVFSSQLEPTYSMKGWVFRADANDPERAAWLGKGETTLRTLAGVTHMVNPNGETTPCASLLLAYQFPSFRPLRFGTRIQANEEDRRVIRAFLRNVKSRGDEAAFRSVLQQLSAMNR